MTAEEMAIEIAKQSKDIHSLEYRMKDAEDEIKAVNKLVSSVEKLALSMEHMAEEQKEQGERLKRLESEPLETAKYSKRAIITGIISAIISAIFGAVLALLSTGSIH